MKHEVVDDAEDELADAAEDLADGDGVEAPPSASGAGQRVEGFRSGERREQSGEELAEGAAGAGANFGE